MTDTKMKKTNEHIYQDWIITTKKGHILTKNQHNLYDKELGLPHLPDMVFADNSLVLQNNGGFGIAFDPFNALKYVNNHENLIQVSLSKDWMAARADSPFINKIINPYDWTYSPTGYNGTLITTCGSSGGLLVESTEININYEKLKNQEQILFFDEVILYEDELDDNGSSLLSVKIRVMPSGFFCLLRFYLRVDNTLVRVYDSRFYFERNNDYLLRECTEYESTFNEFKAVSSSVIRNPNEIISHLNLKKRICHKLSYPNVKK